jgi:hypothetical protein
MSCGRIFGSIVFTNFNFNAENAVAIIPLFERTGFGVHELKIIGGSIPMNLLYLMFENVRDSVENIELTNFSMQNTSNLKVFSGTSKFSKLKQLSLYSAGHEEFYSVVFQHSPVLNRLCLGYNFDIIVGKTMLKRLTIGGKVEVNQGGKISKQCHLCDKGN